MRRLTRILFVNWLACGLVLGLGFFGTLAPFWPAAAQSAAVGESWRVLEKRGSVRFRAPGETQWSQAAVGTSLPPGSRVVTDVNGWVIIGHADGNFWVEPNARFVLPSPDVARVRQEAGNLHYQVISMGQRRFEVETPYASLVVKGTAFDVRIDDTAMAVDVARGWVGIETREGTKADLRAGQAARISAGGEPRLEVRLAPGQAFEPVPPNQQTTPAVQPRDRLGGGSGGDDGGSSGGGVSAGVGGGGVSAGVGGGGVSAGSSSSGDSDSSGKGSGSSSNSPSGAGGIGVGVGVGGISAGVSVGGGGAKVGAGVAGVGVGVGIGK